MYKRLKNLKIKSNKDNLRNIILKEMGKYSKKRPNNSIVYN